MSFERKGRCMVRCRDNPDIARPSGKIQHSAYDFGIETLDRPNLFF
jgi:hypothetical protein